MRRIVPIVVAIVALLGETALAADYTSGRDKFLHGDYAGAEADLAKVRGQQRGPAQLLIARIRSRLGDLEGASKRATSLLRGNKQVAADAAALLGELQLVRGQYQAARKRLEALTKQHPNHLRARYLLGMSYRYLGQRDKANTTFERFFDDYNARRIDLDVAEQAMYLGLAARYLEAFQDSTDAFREATNLDPTLLEANIQWGLLFLEKYAASYAAESFDEVLKTDPHHPDAHAGMARVKLEQSYDVATARHHIEQALATNPRHIPALLVRAQLEIDGHQWDAAHATLAEVFAVNPEHADGRALLATVYWLRDDLPAYERERKRVLQTNSSYAPFFHTVAEAAVREHRYKDAIALEQQAVALDPGYYVSVAEIGTGYLRLGAEAEGLKWLRKAWEGDQYNVRTLNMLDLFEEVIPKHYAFHSSKHFKVRYHLEEQPLLERYVEPLLERAHADMVKRYGFTPTGPLVIELYQDPQHYSVRTVGLPNLGALGVCFGQVITAMSPSGGNINWAQVLWHELSHVFAIQLSNSRVPRWYTEGLSEYETVIARPEWRRELDAKVYAAKAEGRLPSVVELNEGFTKPDIEQVVVAYHLSSLVIQYIAENHGFDKIVTGLKLYGKGKETPAVIREITGQSVPAFDRAFGAYLDKRLAVYRGTFVLPTTGYDDVKQRQAAAAAAPTDANAQAALGLAHYYDGNADEARTAMTAALAIDAHHKAALYVMGELAMISRDRAGAKRYYSELIAAGGDGWYPRGRLGLIAQQEGNTAEAITQLERAKALDPERSEPYIMLAELYEKSGKPDAALGEYEHYVMFEQMQYGPVRQLAEAYAKRKAWVKARKYGELALNINPHDAELLLLLGHAYQNTRAATKSIYTYESALRATPALRRPALAHLGKARSYVRLKLKRRARQELDKALKLEPRNAEARKLRRSLR